MQDSHGENSRPESAVESAKPPVLGSPVTPLDRIETIDVLRGVAVLGILAINIDFFALPMMVLFNPNIAGGFDGFNLLVWKFDYYLFFQKMMAIFSMLFGAGVVLMHQRAEAGGRRFGRIHYRRMWWLLVIAMIHAYVFWYGDILFTYAICGLILFLLRRRSPRLLIILGSAVLIFGALIMIGSGAQFSFLKNEAQKAIAARDAGESLSDQQEYIIETWDRMSEMFATTGGEIEEEIEAYRGSFVDAFRYRIGQSIMMQTQGLLFRALWRALGLMLLGMALMKMGFFSGTRSRRFYIILAVIGYGVGLPAVVYGAESLIAHDFDIVYNFMIGEHYNYFGSVLVSLAHVSLIVLICKANILPGLRRCLSMVGRMALTNYLLMTLICTTVFYGYGGGLFSRVPRMGLFGIVVAIWIILLLISPWWLNRFKFGPAEWLWRTLTYWKAQPMRKTV